MSAANRTVSSASLTMDAAATAATETEAETDAGDPMQLLIVNRHETRETFTRYRLQETLMLMGCRPKDAVAVTKEVFATFDKYIATHIAVSTAATATVDPSSTGGLASLPTADDPSSSSSSSSPEAPELALPWHYLHQCIYSSLARLDYTKPHHLLDFQVAKEITQRNQSFVVLLGGTSGTGKSTLASLLAARLRLTTVLPTDSVRHILRAFTSKAENPCAFVSTYQAGDALTESQVAELAVATDGVMSANRLHKRKVLAGYKQQSDVVLEKLDAVLTMFAKRQQSLVVEGVHLNTDQMVELVRRHPNCVPFVIYISNELKHRERFAVRARHMTVDPQANKYIQYFDNIRIIQRHLCKHADKFLIPKIDNTNVDRSIATIQSTLVRVLRKIDRGGERLLDEKINKMVLLSREHENSIKKAWSSKGVRKAMRPLIKQKVSKRLLLRRLLAEEQQQQQQLDCGGLSAGVAVTHHDSSSEDESDDDDKFGRRNDADDELNEDDDDDEDGQTTVVGSLFSGTTTVRDPTAVPTTSGIAGLTAAAVSAAASATTKRVFLDEIEEHAAGSSDNAKMMRSLSAAIRQAALWRASQPLSNYADWEALALPPTPNRPDVTFSDVIESIQVGGGGPELRQRWKFAERRKSWMAGDAPLLAARNSSAGVGGHAGIASRDGRADLSKSASVGPTGLPFKPYAQSRSTAETSPTSRLAPSHLPPAVASASASAPALVTHAGGTDTISATDSVRPSPAGIGRRSLGVARRVQSLPADALDLSSMDFDLDSISMAGGDDDDEVDDVDDRVSLTSSQHDGCISPLDHDDTDSHFEVSSQSSVECGE